MVDGQTTRWDQTRRLRISQRRIRNLLRLCRELEAEWRGAVNDVRAGYDGSDADDDIASIAQMLTSRMEHIVNQRREVRDALERLAEGAYGSCEDCGKRIRASRLEANPTAVRCIDCQRLAEQRAYRPPPTRR